VRRKTAANLLKSFADDELFYIINKGKGRDARVRETGDDRAPLADGRFHPFVCHAGIAVQSHRRKRQPADG
jgi:hypothetical protein